MRSSDQIKNDVIKQLEWDNRVKASNIIVNVSDHTVTLSGNVGSYLQRMAAETDVLSVAGVSEIHNHLKVIPVDGEKKYTDEQILWNVESVLTLNPVVNLEKLELTIDNGVIFLGGSVDEFWKKMQTEEILFDVPGVKDVVNTLSVVPGNAPYDEVIATEILSALQRISNIDIQNINIIVEGGRVTIQGRVPDWHTYTTAHNAAKFTRGVTDLTNKLTIV